MDYPTPLAYFAGSEPHPVYPRTGLVAFDHTVNTAFLDAMIAFYEGTGPEPVRPCKETGLHGLVTARAECERLHRVIAVSRLANTDCGGCEARMDVPGGWYCRDCAYWEAQEIAECERTCSYPERTCSRCD